ncbi:class I SAM-dependent methyltransferase [Blastococcus saxobsidens]|uniref:Putative SAM-dependent methyltransferase n=1 Tax=Blastococcus saxobsidens (strain DD2) TaxID=1146883 RepID=H6RRA9_BLASD|nr:class I SAM-dependent methyltransferase [Blastococcus saxobsidens]CCG04189.1 Putative SAM-dependent methyltransferase [Blastococcus saxobsidens DD2]
MSIDQQKVEQFLGQVVGDLGATVSSALAHLGDRLGLYRAMAGAGQLTPGQLAERTGTHERYVREWLANQAAGGYVEYEPTHGTYRLPPEHALVLTDEDSPVHMAAGFEQMAAIWAIEEKLESAFRSGDGVAWHEQNPRFFGSTEAIFRPAYRAHLVEEWIPALDGVAGRLQAGGRVADVGCGHGASSILLAQAFPNATVSGFDYHDASIETARRRAAEAGLDRSERIHFDVADAGGYPVPAAGYDLICFFDALHDFGDPERAVVHARDALSEGGTVLLVEIRSGDRTEDNLNPIGRLGYGMSTFVCTPNALSQQGRYALGGQAGPAAIAEIFEKAGYTQFRQIAQAPIHQVFEARP